MGIGERIFGSNGSLFSLTKWPGNTCCWINRVCSALPPTDGALKGLSTASPCSVLPGCFLRERSGHTKLAPRFIMCSQGWPCSLGMWNTKKLSTTQLHGLPRACKTAKCFQKGVYPWLCVQTAARKLLEMCREQPPAPLGAGHQLWGLLEQGWDQRDPGGASSLGHSMALCLCNRGPGGLFRILGVR